MDTWLVKGYKRNGRSRAATQPSYEDASLGGTALLCSIKAALDSGAHELLVVKRGPTRGVDEPTPVTNNQSEGEG